ASSDSRPTHGPRHQVDRRHPLDHRHRRRIHLRREARRRAEQRGVVLVARERGVHTRAREARGLPGPQRHPDPRGLREGVGPHRRRPRRHRGAGGRAGRPRRRRGGGRGPQATGGQPGHRRAGGHGGGLRRRSGRADPGHLQLRGRRVERAPRRGRRGALDRSARRRRDLHRRRRRTGGRLRRGLRRHRHHAALLNPRRGHRDPPGDLPQPGAVDPADLLRRRRALLLPGPDLLPGQVRRPHGQRAELRHPHDPGHRRRHRLRPAAGGPLPRGAAPPRRPARGDGVRPPPRRSGHPRQRRDGGARHALPAARRDELHGRPRSGGRHRHRGDVPGHGDAAAGPAGGVRTLGLLAQAPRLRLTRAHPVGHLGQGRPAHRRAAPGGLGGHDRDPGDRLPGPVPARRRRPLHRGLLHQGVPVDHRPEGAGRSRPGRPVQHRAGGGQRRPGRGRPGGDDRHRRARAAERARGGRRRRLHPGRHRLRRLLAAGLRRRRGRAHSHPCGRGRGCARRRRLGVLPRHQAGLQPRQPGDHPGDPRAGVPHPGRPAEVPGLAADPDRDRGAVLRRRTGHLGAALRVRLRLRRVRPVVPAVRLRLPRRPGHRLQHLLDDQGQGGDPAAWHPSRVAGGAHLHGRRDHIGRAGAGRHLPGAGHHPGGVPGRAGPRGGARRHPRHDDRAVGARHRDQPRPRRQDLVAQQARPRGPARRRRGGRGARDRLL
ncbi:MAG: Hopanoid-associated RND transporter, HpnN, partial [uncultured Nocardioides sp.]